MIDLLLILWFILSALSLFYITYDLIMNKETLAGIGWWLATLYLGPIGLLGYLFSQSRHS